MVPLTSMSPSPVTTGAKNLPASCPPFYCRHMESPRILEFPISLKEYEGTR